MPSIIRPRTWAFGVGTLLLSAVPAAAQTNGTWSLNAGGNWGTAANWSGGNIADGGGTATFNNLLGLLGNSTVTVDTGTTRTVSQIIYDTGFSYTIASAGTGTLTVASGGLTLNSVNSLISSPITYFTTANTISAVITGTGDVIKTGNGFVALTGVNTFTGTVRMNQGTLWANGGDAVFGNAANGLVFDGGALGVNTAGGFTTNRAITINSGGGTLRTFTALTHTGTLSGSGTLTKQIGNANFTIQGDGSGFTGEIRAEGGAVILSSTITSNGRVGGSAVIDVASTLTVDNTTANFANRLNGRPILVRGGNVNLTGGGAAAVEAAGTLTLAQGNTFFTVTSAGTSTATLSFTSLVRQNNAVAFFRGNNLGQDMLENTGRVVFTSSPGTLIGGGGDPNTSTTASVLPFVYGATTAAAVNDTTFLTWNSGTGRLVPVNIATGYATNILTAAAQDNVNQNATAALAAPTTINALRMAPTAAMTISGSQLTVTSGAILQTSAAATPPAATISAPLTAGSQELVVISTSGTAASATPTGLILSGVISGSGGLTRSGGGGVTLTGANTYTGTTTIAGGTTVVGGTGLTLTADGSAPSVFGQDTSALKITGTGGTTRLWTTGNLVINRPLAVQLGGLAVTGIGTVGLTANESVTINGNVTLNNPNGSSTNGLFELGGGDVRAEGVIINGNVSGSGGLRGFFGGYSVLNGNNTYTGGTMTGTSGFTTGTGTATQLFNETWEAGSDTAFGTGPIWVQAVSGAATPITGSSTLVAGGGARTIANPVYMVNGFLAVGGTNPLTLSGPVELNGGAQNVSVITVGANSPLTISGQVARGGLIKNGAGTLTLSNTSNPYSGQTFVRQGVLSVGTIGNGGVAGNLGGGQPAANYLFLSGNAVGDTGTLRYTGAGESTNRLFSLAGTGGTLDASGTGPLVFSATGSAVMTTPPTNLTGATINATTGAITVSTAIAAQLVVGSTLSANANIPAGTTITEVGVNYIRLSAATTNATQQTAQTFTITLPAAVTSRTLTLTGSNAGLNTLFPLLANGGGLSLGVAKTGTGTWVLTGNNTYSAGTTIGGGTLYANNGISTSSATGNGAVTVNSGGTLGGSGFVGGATTVNSGGTVRGGVNNGGTVDDLTVANNVTVNGGGQFGADLANLASGPGTYTRDRLIVDGASRSLNFVTTTAFNIALLNDAGLTNGGAYTLTIAAVTNGATITEGGGTPDFAYLTDFTLSSVNFSGFNSVSLVVNGTNLDLTFTPVPEPGTVFAVGAVGLAAAGWLRRRHKAKAA